MNSIFGRLATPPSHPCAHRCRYSHQPPLRSRDVWRSYDLSSPSSQNVFIASGAPPSHCAQAGWAQLIRPACFLSKSLYGHNLGQRNKMEEAPFAVQTVLKMAIQPHNRHTPLKSARDAPSPFPINPLIRTLTSKGRGSFSSCIICYNCFHYRGIMQCLS